MEINITEFIKNEDMSDFSNSIYNSGLRDIGQITYNNALECSEKYKLLVLPSEYEGFREYISEFGAWDESEILSFSNKELNALLIQLIAGDWNDSDDSRLYKSNDSEWYYYVGV